MPSRSFAWSIVVSPIVTSLKPACVMTSTSSFKPKLLQGFLRDISLLSSFILCIRRPAG